VAVAEHIRWLNKLGERAVEINIIYGEGAANGTAPSGFYSALNYVVSYFDDLFANNVTININLGYGAILDPYKNSYENISSGDLSESFRNNEMPQSYIGVVAALQAEQAPGSSALPAISPLSGSLYMGSADAKALGLDGASTALDGAVGVSASAAWDFSPNTTPTTNEYYLVGALEHEITEVMGRVSYLDSPGEFGTADLYRYSALGVRSDAPGGSGSTAHFSVDNGATNLGSWNNQVSNGDLADWYPQGPAPGGNDAFNDYSNPGVINAISSSDVTLMQALGWTVASPGPYTAADVNGWFQTINGLPPAAPSISTTDVNLYVTQLNTGSQTPAQVQANLENPALYYRTSVADFVLRDFQAAWGVFPTTGAGSQYDNWVARIVANPSLENGGMSQALAGTPEFQQVYGVTGTMIATLATVQAFALDLLGIQPANLGPGALANVGLPVWEVLQNFVQSPDFLAHTAGSIVAFQNALLEPPVAQPTPSQSMQASSVGSDTVQLTGTVSLESMAWHHL
jgi:hypothetical protein